MILDYEQWLDLDQQGSSLTAQPTVLASPPSLSALNPSPSASSSALNPSSSASSSALNPSSLASPPLNLPPSASPSTLISPPLSFTSPLPQPQVIRPISNTIKRRRRLNSQETQRLNSFFDRCPRPNTSQRQQLSLQLGLSPRAIQIWFQNRRAKLKRDQSDSTDGMLLFKPSISNAMGKDVEEEALLAEQQAPTISSASSTTSSTIIATCADSSEVASQPLPTSSLLDSLPLDMLNTEDWLNRALGLAP